LVCKKEAEGWINVRRNNYNISEVDTTIFITYIMLACENYGLGTCLVGMFDDKDVRKVIDIKDDEEPVLFLAIGYPSDEAKPSNYHFTRKQINDLITYK
jgi:nitroreductase